MKTYTRIYTANRQTNECGRIKWSLVCGRIGCAPPVLGRFWKAANLHSDTICSCLLLLLILLLLFRFRKQQQQHTRRQDISQSVFCQPSAPSLPHSPFPWGTDWVAKGMSLSLCDLILFFACVIVDSHYRLTDTDVCWDPKRGRGDARFSALLSDQWRPMC